MVLLCLCHYTHWTVENWKKVVHSDESKINCFGSDGDRTTWKMKGEALNDRLVEGTLKFGGDSLMVWGCVMWEGVGNLVKIDGKMDTDLYTQIMEEDLLTGMINLQGRLFSSRTMTPSTSVYCAGSGMKTMVLNFYHGLHSLQILLPLNTFGVISKTG